MIYCYSLRYKKEIFDTDKFILDISDSFENQENEKNKKTKIQILDEKIKLLWLNKLAPEDLLILRNEFIHLLNLEEDKKEITKIKSNPEKISKFL